MADFQPPPRTTQWACDFQTQRRQQRIVSSRRNRQVRERRAEKKAGRTAGEQELVPAHRQAVWFKTGLTPYYHSGDLDYWRLMRCSRSAKVARISSKLAGSVRYMSRIAW